VVWDGTPLPAGESRMDAKKAHLIEIVGQDRVFDNPGVGDSFSLDQYLLSPMNPAIASLLEREPVMSPRYQWNLLEPLRSLEIVWGNGDKFYSGSGTFRGEKEEDWQ
jgi:hypothetical protein